MDIEKIIASKDYESLKVQFNALKRILASKQVQIEFYQKTIKEFNFDKIIQLEAELESERTMNAILTDELTNKHKGYSKEDVLKAGEIGEINHHDYKHIVSLLDEARELNNKSE